MAPNSPPINNLNPPFRNKASLSLTKSSNTVEQIKFFIPSISNPNPSSYSISSIVQASS